MNVENRRLGLRVFGVDLEKISWYIQEALYAEITSCEVPDGKRGFKCAFAGRVALRLTIIMGGVPPQQPPSSPHETARMRSDLREQQSSETPMRTSPMLHMYDPLRRTTPGRHANAGTRMRARELRRHGEEWGG
jgi:hypothetical protein